MYHVKRNRLIRSHNSLALTKAEYREAFYRWSPDNKNLVHNADVKVQNIWNTTLCINIIINDQKSSFEIIRLVVVLIIIWKILRNWSISICFNINIYLNNRIESVLNKSLRPSFSTHPFSGLRYFKTLYSRNVSSHVGECAILRMRFRDWISFVFFIQLSKNENSDRFLIWKLERMQFVYQYQTIDRLYFLILVKINS